MTDEKKQRLKDETEFLFTDGAWLEFLRMRDNLGILANALITIMHTKTVSLEVHEIAQKAIRHVFTAEELGKELGEKK